MGAVGEGIDDDVGEEQIAVAGEAVIVAQGAGAGGVASLEDAFISYLEEAIRARGSSASAPSVTEPVLPALKTSEVRLIQRPSTIYYAFSLRRLFAYTIRETLELLRDPIRLGFALFGTAFLMLVFGFGISTDVNNLSFAVLDRDQSHESRAYLE